MKYLQRVSSSEKVKFDEKDRKILSELSSNARIPLTQLSKKVSLSREAVDYRIKNYENKEFIQGYRTIVDISKFGYGNYHLFINLNNPSKEVEERIIRKLKEYSFVRAIINYGGGFDFEIALVAKDIKNLDEIITKILNGCADSIRDYEILTLLKTYTSKSFPNSFFKDQNTLQIKPPLNTVLNPDKKDIEVLKIIGEDARVSLSEIAGKVKLSADAVAYRIKNMKKSGIITKFTPVINYDAFGYGLYCLLLNLSSLDEKKEKILGDFLTSDQNVLWAVKTIGRFNLLIYLLIKNVHELQETSINLRRLFPNQINHHEMLVAYEEFKYVYFPKNLF